MRLALEEARAALSQGEVPVGAVVAQGERVLSRAHNLREQTQDPTAHAEMLAIRQAARALGARRLTGCTLYVTLEPCVMCSGAIVQCRMGRIVFGAKDPKAGGCRSLYEIPGDPRMYHRCAVTGGLLGTECAEMLQKFFIEKRRARAAKK